MKAFVDESSCIGCGKCEGICPEVFQLNNDGISEVIVDEVDNSLLDTVKEAESECAGSAISVAR